MAKKKRERVLRFSESELRGLLESEHARGYKDGRAVGEQIGLADGRRIQRAVDDPLLAELQNLRVRRNLLEVLLDGTAPAAAALARIVKGDDRG